jgi:Fibronectin type III domain/IPT/TIG domain/OmpA family
MKKRLLSLLAISLAFSILNPIQAQATPTFYALDNGRLRIGTGSENSVNANGTLQQPFYKSGSTYFKLTYSDYPLDIAIGIGGAGSDNWNLNGTIITTNNSDYNDTYSTARANPVAADTDYSGFTTLSTSGSGVIGYGTIIAKRNFTIGSNTLEVTNTYILGQNDSFIEIRTKVKNTHASLSLTNLRTWVGTRDDWVGNSDGNIKERGDISTGNFVLSPNQATRSPALRIKSGSEGVLFYSTSEKAYASINSCCNFSNAYQQNPATSTITTGGATDGSYAMYVRMNDLAVGAEEEFKWFYAAGALADLNTVTTAVAAAGAPALPTGTPGNTQVALSWTAPTSADPIVGYRIFQSTDGTNFDSGTDQLTTSLTRTITGLTNGTSYYYKVAALTGASPYTVGTSSGASAAIVPRTVPGAPTSVIATRQNAQVSLSWSAPTSNGGSALTDYEIEFSSDEGSTWTPFSDSTSTSTSGVVTGLSNGTAYVFRVKAENIAGLSAPSTASTAVTPVAPFGLTMTLDKNSLVAGQTLTATVTAFISDGVIYPDYGGSAPSLTISTDSAAIFATPSAWSSGVSTVVVTLKTSGSHSIVATSGAVSVTAGQVVVTHSTLNRYAITLASSVNENQVVTATITAQDAFSNPILDHTPSTPVLSSTGNQAAFGTLSSWTNGVATVTVSYASAGARNFIYTDGAISRTVLVTVTVPTTPVVTIISPSTSTTDGGITVTITGSQLTGTTGVTFGGVAATNIVVVSDTEVTVTNPANAEGDAVVVVTTGSGSDVDAKTFTYTPTAATIAARAAAAAAAAARAEAARQAAANQALAQRIAVQAIPAPEPGTATGPIALVGLSPSSAIYVAPEARPTIPGFSSLRVSGNSIEVVPTETFSGRMTVPVTIIEGGAIVTLNIPIIVNPKPVPAAATTPVSRDATSVTWEPSPNAVSYKVVLNNQELCTSSTTSCSIPKILGPRSKMEVITLGNDGTVSSQVLPAYTPGRPIPVLDVKFGLGSSSITRTEIAKLRSFVSLMNEQGFTRVAITAFTDGVGGISGAKSLSSARAQSVARFLDRFLNVELKPSAKGISPNARGSRPDANARKAEVAVQ